MNVLREMYYGNVSQYDKKRNYDQKAKNKGIALYNQIKELLGDKGELLDIFIDNEYKMIDNDILENYIDGFKVGALIVLELNR